MIEPYLCSKMDLKHGMQKISLLNKKDVKK